MEKKVCGDFWQMIQKEVKIILKKFQTTANLSITEGKPSCKVTIWYKKKSWANIISSQDMQVTLSVVEHMQLN